MAAAGEGGRQGQLRWRRRREASRVAREILSALPARGSQAAEGPRPPPGSGRRRRPGRTTERTGAPLRPTGPGRPSGRGPPPSARERTAASRDSDGRRRRPGRTTGRTDLISDNRDLNREDYTI
jgi:hypothetical protein